MQPSANLALTWVPVALLKQVPPPLFPEQSSPVAYESLFCLCRHSGWESRQEEASLRRHHAMYLHGLADQLNRTELHRGTASHLALGARVYRARHHR